MNEEVVRLGITHAKNDSQAVDGDGRETNRKHEDLIAVVWGVCRLYAM